MEKQEAFELYSGLLKVAANLLKERELRHAELSRQPQRQSSDESLFNIFRNRSIRIYAKYLGFIANQILDHDDNVAVCRLPTLRTLMDIYAHFLFVHDDDIGHDTKVLKLLSYQLLAYHRLADRNLFEKLLGLHSAWLDKVRPDYPRKWDEFEYDWLKDKGYLFPPSKNYLSDAKVSAASPGTAKIFPSSKDREIYDHLSQLLHGNPFLAHDVERARYWLAAMSLSTTAHFLESIDNKIFQDDKRQDFCEWLNEVREKKGHLVASWQKEPVNGAVK